MKTSQHIAALILILAECQKDADKVDSGVWGSHIAGVRIRKNFQIVERQLKGLRANIIQIRKAHKVKKKATKSKN